MKHNLIKNSQIIKSNECYYYINKGIFYKIFNSDINIKERIDIIDIFKNNNIIGCPEIYDYIYDDGKIIGYCMKYYKQLKEFDNKKNFNYLKEKCLALIQIYLKLKNDYNICYSDFHSKNVFIYHNNILLLDIDSCFFLNDKIEKITEKNLCDFILSIIYNTSFFQYEIYSLPEERLKIRTMLYSFTNNEYNLIEDLIYFIKNSKKNDIKKVLKNI